jgi:hypothetical protein
MRARDEGMTKAYNPLSQSLRNRRRHRSVARSARGNGSGGIDRAYGWDDLAERAEPQFLDETNEDDHKYQGRLFWPAEFRDEVLVRLLALNTERAAAERVNELLAPSSESQEDAKGPGRG